MGVHAVRNLGVRLPVRLGKARKRGTRQAGSNPASCTIDLLTFRGGICYTRGVAVRPKRDPPYCFGGTAPALPSSRAVLLLSLPAAPAQCGSGRRYSGIG